MSALEPLDWTIRLFVYQYIVDHDHPPTTTDVAAALAIPPSQVQAAFHRLHEHHTLLLKDDGATIRMANPFSGIPTPFRVLIDNHTYYANCAWDAFGIPAMLQRNAVVESYYADTQEPFTFYIESNTPSHEPVLIHFALPFRCWYDDLVVT